MGEEPFYISIFNGDGWSVVDSVTGEQVKWCATEEESLAIIDGLNTYPYFNFNEHRDQLLYWN